MALEAFHTLLELWHLYRITIVIYLLVVGAATCARLRLERSHAQTEDASQDELLKPRVAEEHSHWAKSGPVVANSAPVNKIHNATQTLLPKKIRGRRPPPKPRNCGSACDLPDHIKPLVFFYSLGGTTAAYAKAFADCLSRTLPNLNNAAGTLKVLPAELLDLCEIGYDDYFTSLPKASPPVSYFYFILLPTYNIDTNVDAFLHHLEDTHHDFRVDTAPLRALAGYSVFGFGDRQEWPTEPEGYCTQAVLVDKWMARLTAGKRAYPLGTGDVNRDGPVGLHAWRAGNEQVLSGLAAGIGLGEGYEGSGEAVESDEEDDATTREISRDTLDYGSSRPKTTKMTSLDDVETLGTTGSNEIDFTSRADGLQEASLSPAKDMVPVTSPTYKALTKQGYSIIGSHSGIKLCRWTKSALRGRGSCYKKSFYGIASHNCMEATPSLACANKCVFCWRHGTNPVGTTWRWQIDDPAAIFAGVTAAHYQKIRVLRGVPGVRAERFEEAMHIKHCALSLVGEPIFYPRINELLDMLHDNRISSFLVCNAQHPKELAALQRVTQLYVSIDAADRETLRRIDRPLNRDFWERFCACLDILRKLRFRQRTVFRLTLVKGFNIEAEAEGYAALAERALPCFVEVKGVTYCGTSTSAGAGLTMQNVPFYNEVVAFVEALNQALEKKGLDYGIAAEHAHSCCVLLASKRFWRPIVNDKARSSISPPVDSATSTGGEKARKEDEMGWHTSINYERFFQLLKSGRDFMPEEYCAPTVEWALWGNGGFDPTDQRVGKKGKGVGNVKTSTN